MKTASDRSSILFVLSPIPLALLLGGCLSSKPHAFKMSFLPSAAQPDERAFEAPPSIGSSLLASETPNQLQRALATPPRPPEVDSRIARAEEHFEAGKRFYQLSDIAGARREFDRALDLILSASDNLPDRQRLELKLDQMVDTIYRYDLEGLGAGARQQAVVYDKSPLDSIPEMTFPTDPQLRPKVKEEIAATVSQLPLEENDAVLSYIHYFSSDRGRRTLLAGLRRAGRYRPLIQRILDEEGVPQELIHLAQIESGFLPRARSNKKAVGMWQFIQFRGQEYGLQQTAGSDDRMDPEKATRAAARHLRDLYANFGDWYLAMAAYNCGPGCVERAVQRTGYADYWELRSRSALPHDTLNYVPVILAITIMAKNPKDYDLLNVELDKPIEYDTIHVDTPTSLALIADAADCTRPEVEDLNPALMKALAPAGYPLRVPKGTSATVLTALDLVPASHRANWRLHRVAQGETMAEIAHRFATPAAAIVSVNPRSTAPVETGELLIIPSGSAAIRTPAAAPKATAQRKTSHRRVTSSQKLSSPPAHKTSHSAYKTASMAAKHRPAVN